MNWHPLQDIQQLDSIKQESEEIPVLIFKHSTRCPISSTAMNRLQRSWKTELDTQVKLYYLDLVAFRNVSNAVAQSFSVEHESPQVILIKGGHAVYNQSHFAISTAEIEEKLA
ncbi:MAG: bacillithiol system redox-active protein YtxJ [Spirosomataceae bacterium]